MDLPTFGFRPESKLGAVGREEGRGLAEVDLGRGGGSLDWCAAGSMAGKEGLGGTQAEG